MGPGPKVLLSCEEHRSRRQTEPGALRLQACDDGHGSEGHVPGNGLRGMRERLRQHGGNMTIESRAGGGFRLCLQVPVETTEPFALELRPEPLTGGTA